MNLCKSLNRLLKYNKRPYFLPKSVGWKGQHSFANRGIPITNQPNVPASQAFPESSTQGRTAFKIDGGTIAQEIKLNIAKEVCAMHDSKGIVPRLAVIQVGNLLQSQAYHQSIELACKEVGIEFASIHLVDFVSQEEILQVLRKLNVDETFHGILVQLPLPEHLQTEVVLEVVDIAKDVDGLHPMNLGMLALGNMEPTFTPCTPRGCIELLLRSSIEIEKKRAVVIGASKLVGLPTAILLQRHNATVTVVNKYTIAPAELTREADIVISATGNAHLVRGNWIKPGAVVIDVGITVKEDPAEACGFRMIGDVCFEEVEKVAAAITPVPGGVGPMTIAMLLSNTVQSAQRKLRAF